MTQVLQFPKLGWEFNLNRVAFNIAGIDVYWYGITFALAFVVGLIYFIRRAERVGIHSDDALDAALWAVVGGVIGARAYFVIFQWEALYKDNPWKIFAFREGGLAIYGGVIGAILLGYIVTRIKKIPLLPLLDIGLPALLMGQAIGRWGNFFNMEAFGTNTNLPWGMTSKTIAAYLQRPDVIAQLEKLGQTVDPNMPVHPTFFYEFVWNLIGFLILAYVFTPRRKYDGEIALGYLAWYGLGRMFIEGLRTDSLVTEMPWGMIRVSQYLGGILFVGGTVALVYLHFVLKKKEYPLYVTTDKSKQRIEFKKSQMQNKQDKHNKRTASTVRNTTDAVGTALLVDNINDKIILTEDTDTDDNADDSSDCDNDCDCGGDCDCDSDCDCGSDD